MEQKKTNLSDYDLSTVPSAQGMRVGIVVSDWNDNVTGALLQGAFDTLVTLGVNPQDIPLWHVPGSFELVHGCRMMIQKYASDPLSAIIAIGCVIKGDTPHFDYICQGTTIALSQLNAQQDVPVIYGLITTLNMKQALERAGGRCGNKGVECAITAIRMASLQQPPQPHEE